MSIWPSLLFWLKSGRKYIEEVKEDIQGLWGVETMGKLHWVIFFWIFQFKDECIVNDLELLTQLETKQY